MGETSSVQLRGEIEWSEVLFEVGECEYLVKGGEVMFLEFLVLDDGLEVNLDERQEHRLDVLSEHFEIAVEQQSPNQNFQNGRLFFYSRELLKVEGKGLLAILGIQHEPQKQTPLSQIVKGEVVWRLFYLVFVCKACKHEDSVESFLFRDFKLEGLDLLVK